MSPNVSLYGKNFSILGDSISTLRGYLPPFCKSFYMQHPAATCSGIAGPNDTWWAQVIHHFGGTLCVNNSFSGSFVSGSGFPSATHMLRYGELHCNQGDYFYTLADSLSGRTLCRVQMDPDVILLYLGTNDWIFGVPASGQNRSCFDFAYSLLLEKLQNKYPDAMIVCATLFQNDQAAPDAVCPIETYNQIIRHASAAYGCHLAELTTFRQEPETIDGIHPTYQGMKVLSELWIQSLSAFK